MTGVTLHSRVVLGERRKADIKRSLNQNLAGNQVYYTACSSLVINNSCSKLHCQKDFNLILVSYKGWVQRRAWMRPAEASTQRGAVGGSVGGIQPTYDGSLEVYMGSS